MFYDNFTEGQICGIFTPWHFVGYDYGDNKNRHSHLQTAYKLWFLYFILLFRQIYMRFYHT